MILAKFNRYHDGEKSTHEVMLPTHATITGEEDHFYLANHDARMVLAGLKLAEPKIRWSIVSIECRY